MSSSYSFPLLSLGEMVSSLSQLHILTIKSEDLSNPTFDIVSSIYTAILSHLDPLGEDLSNADFGALELLENPDGHFTSVRVLNLYHKMTDLIASSCSMDFTLKDLLFPKRDRTAVFISGIINLCLYNQDKLNNLQPIVEKMEGLEEQRLELEAKISELNKEILNHEEMSKMEQPIIQEVEAEVKELRQTIQSLNKQQMSLKASFRTVNDKTKEIDDKISSAEFELVKSAQENSKLRSKIVQSPDKLQRALEEKKSIRAEAKNAERAAMQCFQERSSTVEVYLKACKKLSKYLVEMQALQEQVNSAKAVDKDVKVLKAKLSDEGVLDMSLEAKVVEWQGKVEQAVDLKNALEKERGLKWAEAIKELNKVKLQIESKLHDLEVRERNVEAMVAKADSMNNKISSVRESGTAIQQMLGNKCEEIVAEVRNYSNSIGAFFQTFEAELERAEPIDISHGNLI
ncbi:hypothetical protein AAC387_Pa04g1109 [Persea americana]